MLPTTGHEHWPRRSCPRYNGCSARAGLCAGRDWGQEEKGMTEDEMVRWHHRLDGHGFVIGCTRSQLQYAGSSVFVVACRVFSCSLWDLVP